MASLTSEAAGGSSGRSAATRTVICRAAVSLALTAALLSAYDWREMLDKLVRLSPGFVAFAWTYYAGCQWLSAYRWRVLLHAKGVDVPTSRLFMLYMIGMFANNLTPGGLGGDAVKAYTLFRWSGAASLSVASVIVERFCGLLALSALGAFACLVLLLSGQATLVAALTLCLVLGLGGAAAATWSARLSGLLHFILQRIAPRRVRPRALHIVEVIHSYRHHRRALSCALALSLLIQGLVALYYVSVGITLGTPVPLLDFLLFLPLITVITLAPISLGGLGVREAAMIYLFGTIGVPSADVLSISLTAHLLNTALSLTGGLMLLVSRFRPPTPRPALAVVPVLEGTIVP